MNACGCLILGCRTGQKDENGRCVMQPMPGLLSSLAQTDVKEFTFIGPADDAVFMDWQGKQVETGLFNDILATTGPDVRILAKYSSNYYEGRPALAETVCGKGKVLHFGGTFTRENVKEFLAYTGVLSPYQELVEVPEACEIAMRVKDGKKYLFVLNYGKEPQKIVLKEAVMDMDTKDEVQGNVLLKGYETKVYRIF
nr:beta-galactosidase trimerization domain-containing protein [Blautia coccoides]